MYEQQDGKLAGRILRFDDLAEHLFAIGPGKIELLVIDRIQRGEGLRIDIGQPGRLALGRQVQNGVRNWCGLGAELEQPQVRALYEGLEETWNARARALNQRLENAGLPVRVANMSSIWTVVYTLPCRYNWMLQYYLRAEGLALSWVGTGRLIFSLNYEDVDFAMVAESFVAAAQAMARDGWWWQAPGLTNKAIRRGILREMLANRLSGRPAHRLTSGK